MLKQPPKLSIAYVGLGVLVILFGYFIDRTQTGLIMAGFGLMLALSFWVTKRTDEADVDLPYFWSYLLRLLLLFSIPSLSDDVYRFIWDGRLIFNGLDPFAELPPEYLNKGVGLTSELFYLLGSREYFTIYPPLNQAIFFLSVVFTPESEIWSITIMRFVILAFEFGNIRLIRKLLRHYGLPQKYGLLYALNPLVILELTGNLHFEGILIFFLLLALWFYEQKRFYRSALFFGMSVAAKFLPLIFLPLMMKKLGLKNGIYYCLIVGAVVMLNFLPVWDSAIFQGTTESLALYFQKFEFNGSIYYLARWYGFETEGFNIIAKSGKWMALATLISITIYSFFGKSKRLPENMLWIWALYLLFATTVHPWYAIPMLALSVFSVKRFPYLLTALIFLTYSNYGGDVYNERLWVVILEYSLVIILAVYEAFGRSVQKFFFK
jgi:alpha-1,6-mannosyltransferase